MEKATLYEWIGGEQAVRRLVEAFYPKVQEDPLLGPMFPRDIRPVMEKQFMFLSQFFGGPPLYSQKYGHPMMRARHLPFEITEEKAEAWLDCMRRALQEIGLEPGIAGSGVAAIKGTGLPLCQCLKQDVRARAGHFLPDFWKCPRRRLEFRDGSTVPNKSQMPRL